MHIWKVLCFVVSHFTDHVADFVWYRLVLLLGISSQSRIYMILKHCVFFSSLVSSSFALPFWRGRKYMNEGFIRKAPPYILGCKFEEEANSRIWWRPSWSSCRRHLKLWTPSYELWWLGQNLLFEVKNVKWKLNLV